MSARKALQSQSWQKDGYLVSTDHTLVPLDQFNAALASPDMHWCHAVPDQAALREALENSLVFGLYKQGQSLESGSGSELRADRPSASDLEFVGIGRCITDFVTFAYLTDVWIDSEYRGKGLGEWLVSCVHATLQGMPHLRKCMLLTSDWDRSVPFYKRIMNMEVEGGKEAEQRRGRVALMHGRGQAAPTL